MARAWRGIVAAATSLLAFSCLVCAVLAQAQQQKQQEQEKVRGEMNEFVDSVKNAVKEAELASDNKEVLDLGQSLRLLEEKFSGLRAAISQEMGSKSDNFISHADVSKTLIVRTTSLIEDTVKQREELKKLVTDVKDVDAAIAKLKEGLREFDTDISQLNMLLSDLHISHNELYNMHGEVRSAVVELAEDGDIHHESGKFSKSHRIFYGLLLVELGAFVGYLYLKRQSILGAGGFAGLSGKSSSKHYGKF